MLRGASCVIRPTVSVFSPDVAHGSLWCEEDAGNETDGTLLLNNYSYVQPQISSEHIHVLNCYFMFCFVFFPLSCAGLSYILH